MAAESTLRGRHALVTGGNGFIGSHLVQRLLRAGCEVTVSVRPGADLARLAPVIDRVRSIEWQLDVDAPDALAGAAHDLLFHLAAEGVDPAKQEPVGLVRANVEGTLRALLAAQTGGCTRFIHVGSCFEYAPGHRLSEDAPLGPIGEYAATKAGATLLALGFARRTRLPLVVLRPFTVYGPGEAPHRLVPYLVRKALANTPIELTGGTQTRDFVYVDDFVDACVAAAISSDAVGAIVNVATGVATSVRDVSALILELTGSTSSVRFGAHATRVTEMGRLSGDPALAEQLLGWRARAGIRDGLRYTIAHAGGRVGAEITA